ncbi:MAG: DUF5054 domain-containing protein [Clostridia bacterium]|nr:DUF5054 domain-containing protein [Clostridia bacterium]
MKKEVLVLFKTHLDIGFTNYAHKVTKDYLEKYIPSAIRLGYELKDTDTPFIWTVGSWLIWTALKNDKEKIVEKAIQDGIITWHALPFTTQTELMNGALFEYGLSISDKLDNRFGKKTIAAKMTDVPGHTIGMVPYMEKHGIRFLHIGVNPATPVPNVPAVFRWRCGESEIHVMYQGDYGLPMEFDDFVVYFAHTGDNCGPQSADAIKEIYRDIQTKYPDAEVKAATLDDVAERICKLPEIPVLEKEIGDTWIYGAASDPQKMSRYRKILRVISEKNISNIDLSDSVLLVPEHTWGMNVKKYFPGTQHYCYKTFEKLEGCSERTKIEKSWQEQRDYVSKAEKMLGVASDYPISKPNCFGYRECEDCSLNVEISWQLFDNSDYERLKETYITSTQEWAIWDYTKVGLPDYKGGIFTARVTKAYTNGEKKLFQLEFDKELVETYGLPYFYVEISEENIEIKWFDKKASGLPQAFWLKFKGYDEKWQVNKMNQWIYPEDILDSPLIVGVDKGVRNGQVEIESLDTPLVAPFGRRLLQYNCNNLKQDLYFNLYNNLWNTNYSLWYWEDGLFRFVLKK